MRVESAHYLLRTAQKWVASVEESLRRRSLGTMALHHSAKSSAE